MSDKSTGKPTYIVAVSGGIDSVVLLHIMASQPGMRLVVAHFDHGIRNDSAEDRRLVADMSARLGLEFEYIEGRLPADVSEADARDARYQFLRRVQAQYDAQYIATAHHQDDVLETVIINLARGTGRKGLSSLSSLGELYRPLLGTPKTHIRAYARKHGLVWREDSTNANTDYLRNHIRLKVMPRLDPSARARLLDIVDSARATNLQIDEIVGALLSEHLAEGKLDRQWFIMLPHIVSKEVMASWLRYAGIMSFDRKKVEKLTVAAKTFNIGKLIDINGRFVMVVFKDELAIVARGAVQ
jgi:tRNA(Ile)-lysidine synthase